MSTMSAPPHTLDLPPEEIVRGFLDALRSGRVLDALDVFALDGTIRDANGREHRGIREIVQFVNRGRSNPLQIEEIRRDRDTVTAIVRSVAGGRENRLRHTYTLGAGRVRSLRIEKSQKRAGQGGTAVHS